MSQMLQHDAFPMLALCASYLIFMMIAIGHLTGAVRIKRGVAANPEDFEAFRLEAGDVSVSDPNVTRYERVHRNHIESTLPFLAVGMIYLATGPSAGLATGLITAFTILRTVFTVCYINSLQPWRSISFVCGELCLAVMLIQTGWYGLTHL
ncbi:MAG: MAPEG family protein [Deltaproteobacteria bacterium]|nr:MAPEG family protein [Deltaproteobacteria bacterium]MBW2724696.1 MAPEG family protein [Deltaproteobacteria bacterium]